MNLATTGPGAHAPRARGLIVIVWLFASLVVLVLLLASYSMSLLSAARAYVGGEGQWSRAQKQAVQALMLYTLDGQPSDYERFNFELNVILGDRQARIELEKAQPDWVLVWQGLLQGGNHPEDIASMVHLFRTYRSFPDIDRAITIWAEAETHIERLIALGQQIRHSVEAAKLSPSIRRGYLTQIAAIDNALTPLEHAFSSTLASAARKTLLALQGLLIVVVSVLLAAAYLFSRRLLAQNVEFQRTLLASQTQLQSLLRLAPQAILIVRRKDAVLLYANERALAQFRIDAQALGTSKEDDFYVRPQERIKLLETLSHSDTVRDQELELQDRKGGRFWALLSCQRINFAGEECVLSTLTNIDERRRVQQELHYRAFHDELTGLPNRAMFMDALNRTRHRAQRRGGVFLIFFIDLDNFKQINDSQGHRLGDLLLCEVALRLRLCLREGDLVARLGGDEFVILVEDEQRASDANAIVSKIQSALSADYECEGRLLRVSASVGISRYPHDGTELGELMRQADSAMYQAKADRRHAAHSQERKS